MRLVRDLKQISIPPDSDVSKRTAVIIIIIKIF